MCFAQFPTNGLIAQYGFDSGSVLTDSANGANFTQTGSSIVEINNRFGNPQTSAINLNGDYLTRSNIDFPSINSNYGDFGSVSFWIKTSTNDSDTRIILDDSNRSSFATSNWAGYYIYLKDGKIGATLGVEYSGYFSYRSGGVFANKFVSDGNWHHVAVTFSRADGFGGCCTYTLYNELYVYIDGISYGSGGNSESTVSGSLSLLQSHDTNGNITIGNNRSNSLPANNRYFDVVDDILFYNRLLSASEISDIANYNYCYAPNATISIYGITETEAGLNVPGTGIFDIAYVPQGEDFSTAIIITNVDAVAAPILVNGLTPSTVYDVYNRSHCAASSNVSDWSVSQSFRTKGKIFVNANATGNGNGASWANAFTSIQTALSAQVDGQEIWIASGTYQPSLTDRSISFLVSSPNVKLYGGFAGTETQLSDRIIGTNTTVLSGDLLGNDDNNVSYTNTTRDDNSYTVLNISGEGVTLDGVTITGAHSNGAAGSPAEYRYGGAVFKNVAVRNLTISNCKLTKNVAKEAGGAISAGFTGYSGTGGLTINGCEFIENISAIGGVIYSANTSNAAITYSISNSLFSKNKATDTNAAATGYGGSSMWLRSYTTGSALVSNIVNCTFVDNVDDGTASGMSNTNRTTLALTKNTNTTHTATISNCVFWNNKAASGTIARPIGGFIESTISSATITNSIDETNFTGITLSGTSANTSGVNPLFVDAATGNYNLSVNSPAVNGGNNTSVIGTTDLLGKQRIHNTIVDMGAYEYDATTLGAVKFNVSQNFTLYPNPAQSVVTIQSDENVELIEIYTLGSSRILATKEKQIDVSNLPKGAYIVKLTTSEGKVGVNKIIKN